MMASKRQAEMSRSHLRVARQMLAMEASRPIGRILAPILPQVGLMLVATDLRSRFRKNAEQFTPIGITD